MTSTASILTSLHGKRVGLDNKDRLVVKGRRVPSMDDTGALKVLQPTPVAVDATATLTAAELLSGIITSAAAAVTATLPTGTLLDAAAGIEIGEAFDWSVIKVGANSFTLQAGAGHTFIGTLAVATATSARFRSLKTAANTFITYRIS